MRALNVVEVDDDGQTTHVAGSDFVSAQPAKQDYAAIDSMSAIAAFPFVRACVESIASDLTKLPIRVIKGRGADAELPLQVPASIKARVKLQIPSASGSSNFHGTPVRCGLRCRTSC